MKKNVLAVAPALMAIMAYAEKNTVSSDGKLNVGGKTAMAKSIIPSTAGTMEESLALTFVTRRFQSGLNQRARNETPHKEP